MWRLVFCVMLTSTLATSVAHAKDPCGKGSLTVHDRGNDKALYLLWIGTIRPPMHERVAAEFDKAKGRVKQVVLGLSSCGGSLSELDQVAKVLRGIKQTHTLQTWVGRGWVCASACVPIFLQGQHRKGALTSSWLFHEVGQMNANDSSRVRVDRARTERLLQDYFLAAGVSEPWLNQLRIRIQHADYWQTGENLWEDKSGIITEPIDNLAPRGTEEWQY